MIQQPRRVLPTIRVAISLCVPLVWWILLPCLSSSSSPTQAPHQRKASAPLLQRLGVPAWHDKGWRGQGVTVAILDSGFRDYREHLGKSLPETVRTRSFRLDGDLEGRNSQHGIRCAEVIHTLAPQARLLFANWEPQHPDHFLAAIQWARGQGARIISCSVIMPTWSDGEGGGPIHERLAKILGPEDSSFSLLFFASAGNTASRHWSGPFRPADEQENREQSDPVHEWRPGEVDNPILPYGNRPISIELCAPFPDRPHKELGTRESEAPRYEAIVLDNNEKQPIGRATTPRFPWRTGHSCAVVTFLPGTGHRYTLRIHHHPVKAHKSVDRGPWTVDRKGKAGRFHVTVLGGRLGIASPWGSIPFPGDGPRTLAVGAVGPDGLRKSYSSCGSRLPNSLKPDLCATVPFPTSPFAPRKAVQSLRERRQSSWRPRPFSGTSAASPQAAALAALIWSRHPHWTARQVRHALYRAAQRPAAHQPDHERGYGHLHLPALP
jgi:hypothetical protein